MLDQNQLPYSLFLIPYLLFKSSSPTVETVGYKKYRNNGDVKMLEMISSLVDRGGYKKIPAISNRDFLFFE